MPFKAPTNRLPSSSSQVAPGQSSASTAPMTRSTAIRRIKLVSLYFLAIDLTAEVNAFMRFLFPFAFFAAGMPHSQQSAAQQILYKGKYENKGECGYVVFCELFAEREKMPRFLFLQGTCVYTAEKYFAKRKNEFVSGSVYRVCLCSVYLEKTCKKLYIFAKKRLTLGYMSAIIVRVDRITGATEYADVAELADALDSGSSSLKRVWVQIPSSAPKACDIKDVTGFFVCCIA